MKNLYVIPAALAFTAGSAFAQVGGQSTPDFSEADRDGNGTLSVEEARQALPQLNIMEEEGELTVSQVEEAMPELSLDAEGDQSIGEEEYQNIVTQLDSQQSQPGQPGAEPGAQPGQPGQDQGL